MRSRRRWTLPGAAALVAVLALGAWWWLARPLVVLEGRVLSMQGDPLPGISIAYSGGGSTTSHADGTFSIESRSSGGWVTASGSGYLSRTRAALAGDPTLIRLFPDDGQTVRLLFTGDVMFGRRFYDVNEDGDTSDGLLRRGATVADHLRLLAGIQPLLADADLTVINLETPLISDPWFDSNGPRPARFHPTKEFVFGSAPEAAGALRQAGVDIIGLGNNHQYDALDPGIASTQHALLAAGYATSDVVGAGLNIDEAWRPALRTVRGQRIAIVACTIIAGTEHAITYVAEQAKGGAAHCEEHRLTAAIREAAAHADLVIAMIHGGVEYTRQPSDLLRRYSDIARTAGAHLVIDHHPHVVGGLTVQGETVTAWMMGNLLFDQTVWPTFNSYVLRVDVRKGTVVNAYLEPLMLKDYQPVGVVGPRADWVARQAQSLSDEEWVVDDGALMLDRSHVARVTPSELQPARDGPPSPILNLDGACISDPSAMAGAMVGRDEAWTGDFENLIAARRSAAGALWDLADATPGRQLLAGAGVAGSTGVRLSRSGGDRQDIVLSPIHRFLVHPGDAISVIFDARGTATEGAVLQMSWYNDTLGPSPAQTRVPLALTRDWRTLRIDLVVPANGVAAGLFLRLAPPNLASASIDVDNVAVVVWHAADGQPACEYVRFGGAAPSDPLAISTTLFLGLPDADRPVPAWVIADSLPVVQPMPLPPGPFGSGWGARE